MIVSYTYYYLTSYLILDVRYFSIFRYHHSRSLSRTLRHVCCRHFRRMRPLAEALSRRFLLRNIIPTICKDFQAWKEVVEMIVYRTTSHLARVLPPLQSTILMMETTHFIHLCFFLEITRRGKVLSIIYLEEKCRLRVNLKSLLDFLNIVLIEIQYRCCTY